MNNEFKTLLLKIAGLPLRDQRWILGQLTPRQQELFASWQGTTLLHKARRFRKVPLPQLPQIAKTAALPDLCRELAQQATLYIAIILEQGQFEWEHQFLQSHEHQDEIKQVLNEAVRFIKPATKSCVFKQWQTQLGFSDQLEHFNG